MAPRFDGGIGFYRVIGAAPGPRAAAHDSPVELTLGAPAHVALGAPIALALEFANTARAPITLVRPLDGSFEHWRDPGYELYLRDESSSEIYAYAFHGARCGNVNPITKEDYVTLTPGEKRDDVHANGWASYFSNAAVARPGTYSLWAVYRECGKKGGVALGKDRVRADVYRGVHASNAVRLVVP